MYLYIWQNYREKQEMKNINFRSVIPSGRGGRRCDSRGKGQMRDDGTNNT